MALQDLNRELELYPEDGNARAKRADVFYFLGETEKAQADLRLLEKK